MDLTMKTLLIAFLIIVFIIVLIHVWNYETYSISNPNLMALTGSTNRDNFDPSMSSNPDWLNDALAQTSASFQNKFRQVMNSEAVEELMTEEARDNRREEAEVYAERATNFVDDIIGKLAQFSKNPKMEQMLYDQVEPQLDNIINRLKNFR